MGKLYSDSDSCFVFFGITLWLFNIAMENCPFIDDFPIKTSIYEGFSMAMLNNQMVNGTFTKPLENPLLCHDCCGMECQGKPLFLGVGLTLFTTCGSTWPTW
jgi:hypothetical protein